MVGKQGTDKQRSIGRRKKGQGIAIGPAILKKSAFVALASLTRPDAGVKKRIMWSVPFEIFADFGPFPLFFVAPFNCVIVGYSSLRPSIF
jgi:hypothetical protein